jgi:hypothetical protein
MEEKYHQNGEFMPRYVVLLAVAAQFCAIMGCNGVDAKAVLAQSAYSATSLNGNYAISFNSSGGSDLLAPDVSPSPYGAVGTLQFDGIGKVSGTVNAHYGIGSCVVSLAGTYSVQNTGLGTITVTPVVSSGGCSVSPAWRADLAAAQQGTSFNFASNTGTAGSAAKQ